MLVITPYCRPALAMPTSLVSGLWHNQRAQNYCALSTIVDWGTVLTLPLELCSPWFPVARLVLLGLLLVASVFLELKGCFSTDSPGSWCPWPFLSLRTCLVATLKAWQAFLMGQGCL